MTMDLTIVGRVYINLRRSNLSFRKNLIKNAVLSR